MKKLLFVLAFTFIGQQAFPQMYIVINMSKLPYGAVFILVLILLNCGMGFTDRIMTTIDPTGIDNPYLYCQRGLITSSLTEKTLIELNEELNIIIKSRAINLI